MKWSPYTLRNTLATLGEVAVLTVLLVVGVVIVGSFAYLEVFNPLGTPTRRGCFILFVAVAFALRFYKTPRSNQP